MSRFYNTAQPRYVDAIFQPDQNLQLKVAQSELELDNLKKTVATNSGLSTPETFMGWEGDMTNEISKLQEKVDPIVQRLVEDPNDTSVFADMNSLQKEIREAYSSGKPGKMGRHYKDTTKYLQQLKESANKIKDDNKRAEEFSRIARYEQDHIRKQVGDKYNEDFRPSKYSNYMDAQSYLSDNIDEENMKEVFKTYQRGIPVNPETGKRFTRKEMNEKGIRLNKRLGA